MGVADRVVEELQQREAEQLRERAEQTKSARDEAPRRRVAPELLYRTTVTETPVTVTPPTDKRFASQKAEIKSYIETQFSALHEAIAEVVCTRERTQREQWQREDGLTNDRLKLLQREVTMMREQAEQARTLSARAADANCTQLESLRREIALLREQITVERGLRSLQDEVAAARADIPNFNSLEATFNTKQTGLEAKQACLQRELETTRDRLATLRAQHSELQYGLKQLEDRQTKPGIELKFETSASTSRGRAPPGYETYDINWDRLTPTQTAIVCAFADALREIRRNELELLRLGTVDYLKAICDAMRGLHASSND